MTVPHKPMDHTTRERLYEAIIYHHPDANNKQRASVREYFETGDIHKHLGDELYIDPVIAIFMAPQHEIEHFKERTKLVWEWVRENEGHPADQRKEKQRSWDAQFEYSLSLLLIEEGAFFPVDFFGEIFHMTYGDRFSEQDTFPMAIGADQWQPLITPNFMDLFVPLTQTFNNHTYGGSKTTRTSSKRFVPVIDFFATMIHDLPPKYYSLELANDDTREGKIERIRQYNVRRLVAHVNGIVTDGIVDDGYSKVPVDDETIHEKLTKAFSRDHAPEEYHHLVEFLREQGEECVYESAL